MAPPHSVSGRRIRFPDRPPLLSLSLDRTDQPDPSDELARDASLLCASWASLFLFARLAEFTIYFSLCILYSQC